MLLNYYKIWKTCFPSTTCIVTCLTCSNLHPSNGMKRLSNPFMTGSTLLCDWKYEHSTDISSSRFSSNSEEYDNTYLSQSHTVTLCTISFYSLSYPYFPTQRWIIWAHVAPSTFGEGQRPLKIGVLFSD